VTFGELARLPALLEADGMTPALARSASREIGCALRAAMGCRETPADEASTAARARR
jgi:hypothetical protein